ncbi:MAG: hypothetical protein QGG36_06925 [Pirellulaceae bacterium]|nr:hypothetical protein [Pirellulaceae bacterium]
MVKNLVEQPDHARAVQHHATIHMNASNARAAGIVDVALAAVVDHQRIFRRHVKPVNR